MSYIDLIRRDIEEVKKKVKKEKDKFIWRRKKVNDKLVRMFYYNQPPVKPLLVMVPALKCPRCGYFWIPKKKWPKVCPSCCSRLLPEYEEPKPESESEAEKVDVKEIRQYPW